jgi:hypothetical protein
LKFVAKAAEAGRILKLQTITIDLSEIRQKLERLSNDIKFEDARDQRVPTA